MLALETTSTTSVVHFILGVLLAYNLSHPTKPMYIALSLHVLSMSLLLPPVTDIYRLLSTSLFHLPSRAHSFFSTYMHFSYFSSTRHSLSHISVLVTRAPVPSFGGQRESYLARGMGVETQTPNNSKFFKFGDNSQKPYVCTIHNTNALLCRRGGPSCS